MHGRTLQFLIQPAQSPDLNTLDLGAWCSLETDVNELRYDQIGIVEEIDQNIDTVMQSWKSWRTSEVLRKLQSTLYQNCWAFLAFKGRNDYDRRSSPSNPSIIQLQEHLRLARLDPMWSEAMELRQNSKQED